MAFCFKCGSPVPEGMTVCPNCGVMQKPAQGNPGQTPMQDLPGQQRMPAQGQTDHMYQQGMPMQGTPDQMYQQGMSAQIPPDQMYQQVYQQGMSAQIPPDQMYQQVYQQGIPMQGAPNQMYQQGMPMQGAPNQMYQQGMPMQGAPNQMYPQGMPMYPQGGQMPPSGVNYGQGGSPGGPNRGPKKKSNTALIIGIISAVVVVAALVIVLFVWPGVLTKKDEEGTSAGNSTEQGGSFEPYTGERTETPTQEWTDSGTTEKVSTEEPTEKPTEKQTEEPTTEKKTEAKTEDPDDTSFKKYGMVTNLKKNQKKTIKTCTWDDHNVEISATIEWTEYYSDPVTDEILQFGKENNMDLTGYERKQVILEVDFEASENFDKYGGSLRPIYADWYDVDLFEESFESFTDSYDQTYNRAKIKVKGKEKYVYMWHSYDFDAGSRHMTEVFTSLVPAGYDGHCVGVIDSRLEVTDKKIYEYYDKNKMLLLYME